MPPGSRKRKEMEDDDVVLILDSREIKNKNDRNYISRKLQEEGVQVEIRSLQLGDMIWIFRDSDGHERVLDYVVERKTLRDLANSIKDGRYKEQKARLKNSGVGNVIYIIEGTSYHDIDQNFIKAIQTARNSIQINDGFFLYEARNLNETIQYLALLTKEIKKKHDMQHSALTLYENYQKSNRKSGSLTVGELYIKMLMTVQGISEIKARKIQEMFPTLKILIDTFNEELLLYNVTKQLDKQHRIGKKASRNVFLWIKGGIVGGE